MLETGRVTKIEGKNAVVSMLPSDSCAGCNRCSKSGEGKELLAENSVGAAEGDWVEVSVSDGSRLAATVIVFLIPLAALAAGLLLGSLWGELWMFLLGVIFMLLSYTIVWAADRLVKKKRGFLPVIIQIKEKNNE